MELESLFFPDSVAVVGASPRSNSVGYVISVQLLRRFRGKVYLVNPNYNEAIINNINVRFYKSILDINDKIDLAVVAVPSRYVPDIMRELGKHGVKAAVIVSGGFAEVGEVELEEYVVKISREYGIRILGPNCVGVFNALNGLDTMFLPEEKAKRPAGGPIAFISQSGAVMTAVLDWAATEGVGIGIAVNVGNRADIGEGDILNYFKELDFIKVVGIYLEGFRKREELLSFMKAAKSISYKKPLIIYKAGRNLESSRAALSHTAALAGNYEYYRALFAQVGAIEAHDLIDMFDISQAMALLPPPEGKRVLVVTSSGGIGVQSVDALVENGLEVPPTPREMREELKTKLSRLVSLSNPIDLTGSATDEDFKAVLEVGAKHFDAILVGALIHPPGLSERLAEYIVDVLRLGKPIVAVSLGGSPQVKELENRLRGKVPVYNTPRRAARALGALYRYYSFKQRTKRSSA
ncbi:acetate--CoA ligase family protein [Thermoproteus tenax]|uniref:Acyl-CoA synthetase (NDP forming) n=1 Tax=Thermoproteus tenax (strain ATCC 35583 / DSM 2078 / JCM 9277 / NBRC 100435 / Kra 1) TaxID=768679 RepID=G4RL30_THETK|nr:CoA-binding protein [Thermoproteus tenax]CCC82275.1 Acyl-CoA synthetase (NDP forming) [Thermoproteus tenax Kra 1]